MRPIIRISQSIIYCNSRRIVEILTNKLSNDDFSVSMIHGEMQQKERNQIMDDFRNGVSWVLISTDPASRGIDTSSRYRLWLTMMFRSRLIAAPSGGGKPIWTKGNRQFRRHHANRRLPSWSTRTTVAMP